MSVCLNAADQASVVEDLIIRPPQAPELLRGGSPACRRDGRDDEHLEVWSPRLTRFQPRRQAKRGGAIRRIVARLPLRGVRAVAVRHQRVVDALHESRDVARVSLGDLVLDGAQQARPRVAEEALGWTQLRERGLDRGAAALVMLGRPGLRRERELVPAIEPRLTGGAT